MARQVLLIVRILDMALKEFWSKTSSWLRTHKPVTHSDYHPEVDDEGLINQTSVTQQPAESEQQTQTGQVVVKTARTDTKTESLEKLQDGFNKLIDQLQL